MTNHVARLYALALALVVFFVSWASVAARPWATAKADPRVAALAVREQKLRHESAVVQRIVQRRFASYRAALATRQAQIAAQQASVRARQASVSSLASSPAQVATPVNAAAPAPAAAPAVRIVNLPPLVITRTS